LDNLERRTIFDTDRIGSLLLKLTAPAFLGMAVITLYNVVDTIFIGHWVGPLGIAGLSIVFPVQMLSMGVGQMMGMGGASLVSMLHGARKSSRAEQVLGNAVTGVVISSVLIMAAGLFNIDSLLKLIGATEDILPYAREYLQIILVGMFFQTLAMALNFLIRAEGNARVPMIGMIIGAVANIILDAVFIIPLGMGVAGAALATIIAQFFSVMFFGWYYLSGASFFRIRLKNLALDWQILKSIMAIGFSSFARLSANSVSVVLVNIALGSYGGDLAITAYGILNRITMFAIMPGMVIGQGMQPILGYNYGAGSYRRALKTLKISILAATAFGILAFIVLYFFPEPVIRIFTTDAGVISITTYAAKRVFLAIYIVGFIMVASTAFQALGQVFQSIVSSMARSVFFLIPAILTLPRFFQLDGIWLAFPITDVLTLALTLVLFVPQVKKLINAGKQARPQAEELQPAGTLTG